MQKKLKVYVKITIIMIFLAVFVSGAQSQEKVYPLNEVDKKPQVTLQKSPDYPPLAKKAGKSGKVVLQMKIGSDGRVSDVEVVSAEPEGLFETAAIEAIEKWRFQPAMVGGERVATIVKIPLKFEL
jgi:protein TonB